MLLVHRQYLAKKVREIPDTEGGVKVYATLCPPGVPGSGSSGSASGSLPGTTDASGCIVPGGFHLARRRKDDPDTGLKVYALGDCGACGTTNVLAVRVATVNRVKVYAFHCCIDLPAVSRSQGSESGSFIVSASQSVSLFPSFVSGSRSFSLSASLSASLPVSGSLPSVSEGSVAVSPSALGSAVTSVSFPFSVTGSLPSPSFASESLASASQVSASASLLSGSVFVSVSGSAPSVSVSSPGSVSLAVGSPSVPVSVSAGSPSSTSQASASVVSVSASLSYSASLTSGVVISQSAGSAGSGSGSLSISVAVSGSVTSGSLPSASVSVVSVSVSGVSLTSTSSAPSVSIPASGSVSQVSGSISSESLASQSVSVSTSLRPSLLPSASLGSLPSGSVSEGSQSAASASVRNESVSGSGSIFRPSFPSLSGSGSVDGGKKYWCIEPNTNPSASGGSSGSLTGDAGVPCFGEGHTLNAAVSAPDCSSVDGVDVLLLWDGVNDRFISGSTQIEFFLSCINGVWSLTYGDCFGGPGSTWTLIYSSPSPFTLVFQAMGAVMSGCGCEDEGTFTVTITEI